MTAPHGLGSHLPPSTRPLSTAAGGVLADATVVVVDDSAANVTLLERLMARAGVGVVHGFTDSRAALAHCRESLPDLVLLDLHMPALDGFAVMDALKGMVPHGGFLPVLVLTADVTPQIKERALVAGAKDFVTKPFDRTEVLLRITNLLETRSLYNRLERHNAELQTALDEHDRRDREAAAEHERRRQHIQAALAPGVIAMVFQPIADLTTGAVVGAEALARFNSQPTRPPDEWFTEAQQVGLGVELELAAVEAGLAQLDQLPPGAFMALNASPTMAMAPALEALLCSYPAERVVLELTEHTPVYDYDALIGSLERLRRQGVRIAVDDTGAGYAGFQHILRLRPQIIKLDTTLTRGIDEDPARRALAAGLLNFGREINAMIVAEGIEISGELASLRRIGIRWGQGYHLAPPGSLPLPPDGWSVTDPA